MDNIITMHNNDYNNNVLGRYGLFTMGHYDLYYAVLPCYGVIFCYDGHMTG
jgi:hypothetical protein